MNNLFAKRRTKKVGAGAFTNARLILSTKIERRKRATLAGNVAKPLKVVRDINEAKEIKKHIQEYITALTFANIPVFETKIIIAKKRNNKFKIIMLQPLINKELVMSEYLKHCSNNDAIFRFKETLSIVKKIREQQKTGTKLGIDANPKNMCICNGKTTLLDFYPAFLEKKENLNSQEISKQKRGIMRTIKLKLFPKRILKITQKRLDKQFDMQSQAETLLQKFIQIRPSLEGQFRRTFEEFKAA